jgi:hypothetical protein
MKSVDVRLQEITWARNIQFFHGTKAAARYLRNCGFAIEVALQILLGR